MKNVSLIRRIEASEKALVMERFAARTRNWHAVTQQKGVLAFALPLSRTDFLPLTPSVNPAVVPHPIRIFSARADRVGEKVDGIVDSHRCWSGAHHGRTWLVSLHKRPE